MIDRDGWVNIGGINYFLDDYQQFSKNVLYGYNDSGINVALKYEKDFLYAYTTVLHLRPS